MPTSHINLEARKTFLDAIRARGISEQFGAYHNFKEAMDEHFRKTSDNFRLDNEISFEKKHKFMTPAQIDTIENTITKLLGERKYNEALNYYCALVWLLEHNRIPDNMLQNVGHVLRACYNVPNKNYLRSLGFDYILAMGHEQSQTNSLEIAQYLLSVDSKRFPRKRELTSFYYYMSFVDEDNPSSLEVVLFLESLGLSNVFQKTRSELIVLIKRIVSANCCSDTLETFVKSLEHGQDEFYTFIYDEYTAPENLAKNTVSDEAYDLMIKEFDSLNVDQAWGNLMNLKMKPPVSINPVKKWLYEKLMSGEPLPPNFDELLTGEMLPSDVKFDKFNDLDEEINDK